MAYLFCLIYVMHLSFLEPIHLISFFFYFIEVSSSGVSSSGLFGVTSISSNFTNLIESFWHLNIFSFDTYVLRHNDFFVVRLYILSSFLPLSFTLPKNYSCLFYSLLYFLFVLFPFLKVWHTNYLSFFFCSSFNHCFKERIKLWVGRTEWLSRFNLRLRVSWFTALTHFQLFMINFILCQVKIQIRVSKMSRITFLMKYILESLKSSKFYIDYLQCDRLI